MVEAKPPSAKKSRWGKKCRKVSDPGTSTEAMEERIWKEFPEDLFEAVIARLPVTAFFRFRSVCQKWNALVNSESFSQHRTKLPRAYPWFYTMNLQGGVMYDPSTRKWYRSSFPSLPSGRIFLPVTSAGGLLCFSDIRNQKFFICNPLTGSTKELPPPRLIQGFSRMLVGMTLNGNSASSGYKVLCLGTDGVSEIYDSVQDTWSLPGIIPASIRIPLNLNFRSPAVSIDSSLYFMRADPDGIVSYDVVNGIWKQISIPSPPDLMDHTLAVYRRRIMLVGLLKKNAATCVSVWELQKMTLLWNEVDRMPNLLCLDYYGREVRMTCLGNQGLLMLSLRSGKMNRLITYSIFDREWRKVANYCNERKRYSVTFGSLFHPCPTALA